VRTGVLSFEAYKRKNKEEPPAENEQISQTNSGQSVEPPAVLESFDIEVFWKQFAAELAASNRMSESTFLKDRKPVLDGSNIRVAVPGQSKKELMEQLRPVMLDQIRKKWGISFTLEITVEDLPELELKPYTPREIIQAMIRKNPKIGELLEQIKFKL
jgi:hypothetical protein